MQLAGGTFLITGGGSGLGAACARRFAEAGARVVIADLNLEAGQTLAAEIGGAAQSVATDVASSDSVCRALEVARQSGPLTGVINCAGIVGGMRIVGREGPHPLAAFERIVGVNLIGTFNVIRLAAAVMAAGQPNAEGERGVIINTASVAAFDGQIGQAAYAASKGGVVSMTLPLARDLARHGIRVVAIAPGVFATPMMQSLPQATQKSLAEQIPFPPRLGRPEEFAQLAQAIVENPMLNGEVIRLDGALRMGAR